jgi:hypothetical protein
VTSANEESAYKAVNVRPLANLHNVDVVQVLTAGQGTLPYNLSRLAVALPAPQSGGPSGATGEQLASTGAGG